jgi:hypothetical protein
VAIFSPAIVVFCSAAIFACAVNIVFIATIFPLNNIIVVLYVDFFSAILVVVFAFASTPP